MVVADRLKISEYEVLEMSADRFACWVAFINLENEQASPNNSGRKDQEIAAELKRRVSMARNLPFISGKGP